MNKLLSLCFALAMFAGSGAAFAVDVEVKFSPRIEKSLVAIDAAQQRSGDLRAYLARLNKVTPTAQHIRNMTFENLVQATVAEGLSQLGHSYDGHTLLIEIDSFSIPGYSLARFRGMRTRMKGRFSLIDAEGNVIASEDVKTLVRSVGSTVVYEQSNLEGFRETLASGSADRPGSGSQSGAAFVAARSNPGGSQIQHSGPPLRVLVASFVETGFDRLAGTSG